MDIPKTTLHFRAAFKYCFSSSDFKSQKAVAIAAGVSESVISEINKNKSYGPKTQTKIARAFDYELLDFLTVGKRLIEGGNPEQSIRVTVQSKHEKKIIEDFEAEYSSIPLYESGKLAAGENGMVFDPYEQPASSIMMNYQELKARRNHRLVGLKVGGASMVPLIPPGSIVIIDLNDREFINGKIYAVNYPDKGENIAAVKRIQQWKHGFVLLSYAPEYPPELSELDWGELCVGKAVWIWRSLENM